MGLCRAPPRPLDGPAPGRWTGLRGPPPDALEDEAQKNESEIAVDRLGSWRIVKQQRADRALEVRAAAVSALGNHNGTVVVMDPKTGRVYTVVNQDWGLRRGFKPCSTIKLVTGVAGSQGSN